MGNIAFVLILALGLPFILAIWLVVRAVSVGRRLDELSGRMAALESAVERLSRSAAPVGDPGAVPSRAAAVPEPLPAPPPAASPPRMPVQTAIPPPLPTPAQRPEPFPQPAPSLAALSDLPSTAVPAGPRPRGTFAPPFDWEQFMGVKLFAWVAGLALFLGVAFFVKYSFDNNLIPPTLRVAIGFAAGLALLVGGVMLSRKNYRALSQTLCATGVVILYAVTFACRGFYHFEFFGPGPTFILLVLITTTAFLLAVRLNALVVAVLGMLGGFLTPLLLSTGQDNPLGLFGYIAVLDTGLIFVAIHRRWGFLTALAGLGTVLMQIGWLDRFFTAEKYFEGQKILVVFAVLLGFIVLYLLGVGWVRRRAKSDLWLAGSTLGLAAVALGLTVWFLDFPTLAHRPWLLFAFVFLVDLGVSVLGGLEERLAVAPAGAGLAVFGLLTLWTQQTLTAELLNAALVYYFVFALFHSLLPTLSQRRSAPNRLRWPGQWFPIMALALVLVPIFKLTEVSWIVWPFVLLVDGLAIVLAVLTATLLPVMAVLVLTLAATGLLIFKIPAELTGLPSSFFLLGAFALFFVAVSVWLVRRFAPGILPAGPRPGDPLSSEPAVLATLLPACSATLPFLLLIMASLRLNLVNPTPLFGLALLLAVLVLGLTRLFSLQVLPAIALGCVAALEAAWHFRRFDPQNPLQPHPLVLAWYLIFFALFTGFPFLFLRRFRAQALPWATSALAGLPQFLLIYHYVTALHPNSVMGLLPAVFVLPPLLSLVVVLKKIPAESPARLAQLAWFGGAALFFITLIFPIQFDHQWLTLGWGLEGVALLWLFERVPHPGLKLTGVGLLIAAFVRLALNPAVLEYHPRSSTPIFNWFLYSYGLVILCLFGGGRLLAPPRHRIGKINAPPILATLGTVLAFILLNLEIADYFTKPDSLVSFELGGQLARTMTFTIAWALFALVLIVIGIVRRLVGARYAALALLSVTLLKLFFHDLAHLSQLYLIGAFISVAVIVFVASFAYQRFFTRKAQEQKNEKTP